MAVKESPTWDQRWSGANCKAILRKVSIRCRAALSCFTRCCCWFGPRCSFLAATPECFRHRCSVYAGKTGYLDAAGQRDDPFLHKNTRAHPHVAEKKETTSNRTSLHGQTSTDMRPFAGYSPKLRCFPSSKRGGLSGSADTINHVPVRGHNPRGLWHITASLQ